MIYNKGVYVIVFERERERVRDNMCVSEIEDKTMMKRKRFHYVSMYMNFPKDGEYNWLVGMGV